MLVALVLISIPSVIESGPKMVGESYVDSDEFNEEMDQFYAKVGPVILNPLELEDVPEMIEVTADEIEEHRMRYGTLPEQISNIHAQYDGEIENAEEAGNSALKARLTEERDAKITDIEKNFESDAHIEEKIRAEKLALIKHYISRLQDINLSNFPIAYEFIDIETGEVFSEGDINVPAAYKKTFGSKEGYLKANSVDREGYINFGGFQASDSAAAIDGDVVYELLHGNLTEVQNPVRKFEGVVVVSKKALQESFLSENVKSFNKMKYTTYTIWGLAILAVYLLFTVLKFKKEWIIGSRLALVYDRFRIDMKAIILFLTLYFTVEIIYSRAERVFFYNQYYTVIWTDRLIWFGLLTLAIWFIAFQLVTSVERWKHKGVFEQDLMNSYTLRFFQSIQELFLNRSVGVQMFILLIGFFLAGIGFVAVALTANPSHNLFSSSVVFRFACTIYLYDAISLHEQDFQSN